VRVLLLEVQKHFSWDEEKCRTSPFYCIARLSGVDFYSKFKHILEIPVYSEVFRSISEEILNMKPTTYRKAIVYGVPFKARGMNCRETEFPSDLRYGAEGKRNQQHSLRWWDKKEYSCWCKFSQSRNKTSNVQRYGQINSFFKLNLSDPILKDLLVASITSFKFGALDGIETVRYNGDIDTNKFFVSLQDIYPSQVATIPFSRDHKALSKRISGIYGKFIRYFGSATAIDYYVMITLQPENLSLYSDFRPLHLQK
jgi:hypothetical protein